ncbi:hypothetical protein FKP32DRAFT_1592031 [Trametes sanguinea]|nr:hypothetical protein FKP32DRAFT_1592031 [Trametes sanguinea]
MPKAGSAFSSKSLRFRLVHHGTTLKRWTVNDGQIVMPVEDTQNQEVNPIDEQLGQVLSSLDLGRSSSPEANPGGRKSSKKLRKKSVRFKPHTRPDERSDSDGDAPSPPSTSGARPTSPSSWSISRTTRAIVGGVKKHIKGRLRSLSPPPADSSLIPTRPNTPSPQPSSSTTSPICHRPAWEHGRLPEDPSQLDDFEDTELFTEHWTPSHAPATVPEAEDELAPYEEFEEPAPVLAYSDAPFMGTVSLPEVADDAEDELAEEAYIPSVAVDDDTRPGVDWDEYNLPVEVTDRDQAANADYEGDCDSNDDGNNSGDEGEAAQLVPTEPNTPVLQLQALQLCEAEPVNRPVSEEEVVDILNEAMDEAIIKELAQLDFGELDENSYRRSSAPSLDLPKPEDFLDVPGLTLTPPTPPPEAAPQTPPAHHSELAPTPIQTRSCRTVPLVIHEIERSPPPTSDVSTLTSHVELAPIEKLAPPQSIPLIPQTPARTWPGKDPLPIPKNMVFNYTSHKVVPMFADHPPMFAPPPPTTVYRFEIDAVMDVDRLEEDMEMDDATSLFPSHPQYPLPPYPPPQYHLPQYPHPLYPPPQYRYPRYPLSPPPRYTPRRRTTTTPSGHILNLGRPSPPRRLPRPPYLRRSSSPPSAANRRVRSPRRLQNRNVVKRSYRRRHLAATRQKRLRSLQMRAQRAIWSDEDDAMDGRPSVAHQWVPTYYPRRSYADLPDEDEEMSDASARAPRVGADRSTRDASPNAWQPELTIQVPEVPSVPLLVTEATGRPSVGDVAQVATAQAVEAHRARDADSVGPSTTSADLVAAPAFTDAAPAVEPKAASTAATALGLVSSTPAPTPAAEPAPVPEVTVPACPEPVPRPVIASAGPALDYLTSSQDWRHSSVDDDDEDDDPSQWEVVVAPLPRAVAAAPALAPASATSSPSTNRGPEDPQQASVQKAEDATAAPEPPTAAADNAPSSSVAAPQVTENVAALLSLADPARAQGANGGGSSRRREANLARELARKKIIEAAKALQQQQANESPAGHVSATLAEQSSNTAPDASASHTHHRSDVGVNEQSEEYAPPTPRVDKGKGKDMSWAEQPLAEEAAPAVEADPAVSPEVDEELAKSLLSEEELKYNMDPLAWSQFDAEAPPAPLEPPKPGPSRLSGYSPLNDVPAVQVGTIVKCATISTARDKSHEASSDMALVDVSSPPDSGDSPGAESAMGVTSPSSPLDWDDDCNVLTVSEKWQPLTPSPAKSDFEPISIPTIEVTPPSPDAASSEPAVSLYTPDDILDAIDAPDTPVKIVEDGDDDDDDDFPEPLWQRTPSKPTIPKENRPTRQLPKRLKKQHAAPVSPVAQPAPVVPLAVSSYSSLAGALGDPSSSTSRLPTSSALPVAVSSSVAQGINALPGSDVSHGLNLAERAEEPVSEVPRVQEVVAHVAMDASTLAKDSAAAPSTSPASLLRAEDAHTEEALLLLAFAQSPRIDASRTSLNVSAAPLPTAADPMDGIEASRPEDFGVTLDDDPMKADLSAFDALRFEEHCASAPSPAYNPYEDASSPYEAAQSSYYGELSHVSSPAAIEDMHTDDMSAMALQIIEELKAQQTPDMGSSHEVTMSEPLTVGEGQSIAMVVQDEDLDTGAAHDHRMDDASVTITEGQIALRTPGLEEQEVTQSESPIASPRARVPEPLSPAVEQVEPAECGPETSDVNASVPSSCTAASTPVPESPTSLAEVKEVEQSLADSPKETGASSQPVEGAHPQSVDDDQALLQTGEGTYASVESQDAADVPAALNSTAASSREVQDPISCGGAPAEKSNDSPASASTEEIDVAPPPDTATPAEVLKREAAPVSFQPESEQLAAPAEAQAQATLEQRRDAPAVLANSDEKTESSVLRSNTEQLDASPKVQATTVETSASPSTSRSLLSRAVRRRNRIARVLASLLGMPCTTPIAVLMFAIDGGYSDIPPDPSQYSGPAPYRKSSWAERRLKMKPSRQQRTEMMRDIPPVVLEEVVSSLKSERLERDCPLASGVDSAIEARRRNKEARRRKEALECSQREEVSYYQPKAGETDPLPDKKPSPVVKDHSKDDRPARALPSRPLKTVPVEQVPPVVEDKPRASRPTRPLPSRLPRADPRPQPSLEAKKGRKTVDEGKGADAPRATKGKPKGKRDDPKSKSGSRQPQAKVESSKPRPAKSSETSQKKPEPTARNERPRSSQPQPRSRRPYCSGRYSANFDVDDEADSEEPETSTSSPTSSPQPSGNDDSRTVPVTSSRLNSEPQQTGTALEEAVGLAALLARRWPTCLLFLCVFVIDRILSC